MKDCGGLLGGLTQWPRSNISLGSTFVTQRGIMSPGLTLLNKYCWCLAATTNWLPETIQLPFHTCFLDAVPLTDALSCLLCELWSTNA